MLDTEGLGDMMKAEETDSKLFALAVLLCSLFVYNSLGAISGIQLNDMSNILKLTELISKRAHKVAAATGDFDDEEERQEASDAEFFPTLLWIVRDFALKNVDASGDQRADDEYLAKALTEQPGDSENILRFNRVRRTLKKFFPQRFCKCLVAPFKDDDSDEGGPREEKEKFVEQIVELRNLITSQLEAKTINGTD